MITNAFQKTLDEKICVDKSSEFSNRLMKSWSQDNNIETHSAHNEEKSIFINKLLKP